MNCMQNKNIVVMGATSGIGAALAEYYSQNGANVGIYGRRKDRLTQVAEKCVGKTHAMPCDATDYAQVEEASGGFMETFGSIDVWINCAGQNKAIGKTWEIKPELLWEEVTVDLKSCMNGTHVALQHFVPKNKGIILNYCGGGTMKPHLYASAYSSAKTGIARFTEAVYLELKEDNLDVEIYATNPGLVKNERTELLCTDPNSRKYMPDIQTIFDNGGGRSPILTASLVELALEGKLKDWSGRLVLPFDLEKFKTAPVENDGWLRV